MIEKELEYAQRKMAAQKYRIRQLEKEADWLAFQLAQEPTVYLRCFGCETNLFGDTCVKCWRQEAQKAVSDEQIRSDG